jgi:drug/metabolite transporter (DMT)-like permease
LTTPKTSIDGFATAMMLLLTFSWGLNQVAIKLANAGYSPLFAMFLRSVIGGLLVWGWAHYRRIELFRPDGTLWGGILVGLLFAGEFILLYVGLDYTTAARSILLLNAMPFWVLLGSHFLGEKIVMRKAIGLALAFGGVILVFSDRLSTAGQDTLLGDIMCFVAGILWAGTVLAVKGTKLSSASPEKTLLYQLLVSAIVLLPCLPFLGELLRDVDVLSTVALTYQTIFVVAFTYVLWFWLMQRYPASGLASFAFLTPVFGVFMSWLVLNEPWSINIFGALALIALGLLVVNRPARASIPRG